MRKRCGVNDINLVVTSPQPIGLYTVSLSEVGESTSVGAEGVDALVETSRPGQFDEFSGGSNSARVRLGAKEISFSSAKSQLTLGDTTQVLSGGALVGVGPVIAEIGRTGDGSSAASLRKITKILGSSASNTLGKEGVGRTLVGGSSTMFSGVAGGSICAYSSRPADSLGRFLDISRADDLAFNTNFLNVAGSSSGTANTSWSQHFDALSSGANTNSAVTIKSSAVSVDSTFRNRMLGYGARRKRDGGLANTTGRVARGSRSSATVALLGTDEGSSERAIVELDLEPELVKNDTAEPHTVMAVASIGTT